MSVEPDPAAAELEQALRESERRLGAVVAGAPLVLWAVDRDLKFTLCEGRGLEVFGLTPERLLGRDAADLYADRPELVENARRALLGEEVHELVDYYGRVWDVTYAPLWEDGQIAGVIGVNTDVTDRRRTEQALEASELRYRSLVEHSPDGVLAIDGNGAVIEANPSAVRLLGRTAEDLAGRPFLALVGEPAESAEAESGPLVARRPDGVEVPVELQMIRHESKDGPAVTAVMRDLTERRRQELRLRDLADHDPLTGLLNRRRFEEELARVIARCARYERTAAAVLLDLDELKAVNDANGHTAGDTMLHQAATALRTRVRADDVLARIGGDEFAVVLEDSGEPEAHRLADDLLAALREQPLTVGTQGKHLSASAGVTLLDGTDSPEAVLTRADAAMYEAKELGRDRVVSVGRDEVPAHARQAWSQRIRAALDAGRFELFAQPTADLHSEEIALHEVLVRLREPDGRLLPSRTFVAQAERAGLACELDRAVIGLTARALAAAPGASRVSVNLSAASLTEPGFAAWVEAALARAGVEPDRLVLEFAEHTAMNDSERAAAFAEEVRERGMGVALDDFGAGFASFTALKHVPVDFVKIDREYSAGARTVRADRVLVRGLVQMARGLGIRTIAQHVEDAETRQALHELGVDLAQGHAIGAESPIGQALASG